MESLTSTKLALVSRRAREDSKFQFISLAHLLNAEFLRGCYRSLGKEKAPGIDGKSWHDYGKDLDANLIDLVERLKAKRYYPLPAKRVYIPKGEHGRRPLGLPAIEDKIVQKGIARILEAIYEADFCDCSYGFRPKRSGHQALKAVNDTIMFRPVSFVIEADIKGFFDHVSHDWMMKFLKMRIRDSSLLLLIRRFLKAGYMEAGQWIRTEQGTPQGGNLSPMLANIFLHYVLDLWFEKRLKPQVRGECHLVRYADDFLCLVQYVDDAQRIEPALSIGPRQQRCRGVGTVETGTFDNIGLELCFYRSIKDRDHLSRVLGCATRSFHKQGTINGGDGCGAGCLGHFTGFVCPVEVGQRFPLFQTDLGVFERQLLGQVQQHSDRDRKYVADTRVGKDACEFVGLSNTDMAAT